MTKTDETNLWAKKPEQKNKTNGVWKKVCLLGLAIAVGVYFFNTLDLATQIYATIIVVLGLYGGGMTLLWRREKKK